MRAAVAVGGELDGAAAVLGRVKSRARDSVQPPTGTCVPAGASPARKRPSTSELHNPPKTSSNTPRTICFWNALDEPHIMRSSDQLFKNIFNIFFEKL